MAFQFFFSAGEETKGKTHFSAPSEMPERKPGSFGKYSEPDSDLYLLAFGEFLNLPACTT